MHLNAKVCLQENIILFWFMENNNKKFHHKYRVVVSIQIRLKKTET